MLPSVQCFLTFSGLSTTVLNPSASANLKPRVAEKRLNMEWIWGQQNRMGCGLACSWHTHAATFFKSFLVGIFGYKICPFVTAGIQPWCSCCQLTQEWPSNCHMSPRPPIYSILGCACWTILAVPTQWHYEVHVCLDKYVENSKDNSERQLWETVDTVYTISGPDQSVQQHVWR